ncbi:MAG: hypothetical protein WB762_34485 [Candidatus Sulfotelmatobacter sp.]
MADRRKDELDSMLDAALVKYAAGEPRVGLENRVLSNLRAEGSRVPDRAGWRWSVAEALLAVVVVALAVALAWRSDKPSHPVASNHSSTAPQVSKEPATPLVATGGKKQTRGNQARSPELAVVRRPTMDRASPKAVKAALPKLDQFPSPRPLSEQEKILASYIEQYPERAVLLARARTFELQRDQLEEIEMKTSPSHDLSPDSDERNHDTTER